MQIRGCRIHIAGSADANISPELLRYGHNLIELLVRILSEKGAVLLVGVGKEPRLENESEALAIIFDWTVISTINRCLKSGIAVRPDWRGKVLITIATQKTDEQIPEDRREIWQELLKSGAVQLEHIEPGWASGAERRSRLAGLGDILLLLSGGEGVEHLAREYAINGKPVIPIDLNLGSCAGDGTGGAARLAGEMLAHPDRFFTLPNPSTAGTLLETIATHNGRSPVDQVAEGIIKLIEAIEPAKAFYIRLLAREHGEYPAVEQFFRNVVDPLIHELGYKEKEMGLSDATRPWINVDIFDSLHNCVVAVADLTGLRSNCFIELGYALGRSRRIILTAKKGTELPFNSKMLDCYFWQEGISNDVRLEELKEYWGRNIDRLPLVRPREIL